MIKTRAIAGVLCTGALIFMSWLLWQDDSANAAPTPSSHSRMEDKPSSIIHDKEEIFQRAFWRRPSAEDRILHAERREWTDDQGTEKWQWFIKIQASPKLMQFLREENPFALAPVSSPPTIKDQPSWFVPDYHESDIFLSRQGALMMCFDRKDQVVFASDHGYGFRAGAPESIPAVSTPEHGRAAPPRRLPDALPPANNTQSR